MKKKFTQSISILIPVVLLMIQLGAMCGWTSPYLARLTVPGSPIFLTLNEASWVAALLNVGRFAGAIIGALCVYFWGSKKAMIHTLMPIGLSWLLIILADRPLMLYLARLTGGIGLGMTFSCFPLYVGEIALPEIRGAMVTVAFCGSPFGNVIASMLGYYLSISLSGVVFLAISLANMLMFMWLPDSPHHLVKIGDLEAAKSSIHWYRNGEKVEEELIAVQKFVSSSISGSFKAKLEEFKSAAVMKGIFIVMMLFIFLQICGLNSVLFYMEIIFRRGQSNLIHPSWAVVLVNLSGAITSVLAVNMIDRYGRRILLIASGCGVTVAMTVLGTHFLLIDLGFDPVKFQWLPVASVFMFMLSFIIGLMSVPSTVLSEIFPANIKCIAACMASLGGAVFAFGATKTYQPLVDLMGEAYVFYIHAALTSLVIPFTLYFMPETKGKSLQQIQDELMQKQ